MQQKQQKNVVASQKDVKCGKRLRECRCELGLTQLELADAIFELEENNGKERSANQIGYMERGVRPISREYADLLSQVLGVRAEYLLGKDDYKNGNEIFIENKILPALREEKKIEIISNLLKLFGYDLKRVYKRKTKKISFCEFHENDEGFAMSWEELQRLFTMRVYENVEDAENEYVEILVNGDDDKYTLTSKELSEPIYLSGKEVYSFAQSLYAYVDFTINQHIKNETTKED